MATYVKDGITYHSPRGAEGCPKGPRSLRNESAMNIENLMRNGGAAYTSSVDLPLSSQQPSPNKVKKLK